MKKFLLISLFVCALFSNDEKLSLNFKNLKLSELVKICSSQLNKNILYSGDLDERVNFVSSSKISKEELFLLLENSLKTLGKEIVKVDSFYLIKEINSKNINKRVEIIEVLNSDIDEVSSLLDKFISNQDYFNRAIKPIITYDKKSNSLILAGNENDVLFLKNIIKSIDSKKSQVYVKVKIIEISETRAKNIGIEYGLRGFNKFSNTTLGTFSSSLNSSSNISSTFGDFSTFGYDITSLGKAISLGATINFLKQNEALNVVSEPSILCVNNKESSIYVGETKSFKTGQTTNETGTTESYKREDIGLRLKVKPRVANNKVILEISSTLEDAKESSNSTNVDTSKKEILTTAILNNAETVVIGGLIKEKGLKVESKVPLLGDIPLLGNMFKNEKYINDKIDLAIVITPYIINEAESLSDVKQKIEKLGQIENDYLINLIKKLEKKDINEHTF